MKTGNAGLRILLVTGLWQLAVVTGVAQTQDPQLLKAIDTFYASIASGDPEPRIELLADDVIMMPNHWTLTQGREQVAASYRWGRENGWVFDIKRREIVRLDISGNLAYTVNSYFYSWHPEDEEPQWHKTKNVHIWQRQEDGNWLLTVDIWNSDVPLADFEQE